MFMSYQGLRICASGEPARWHGGSLASQLKSKPECDRTSIHQSFADKLGGKPVRFEKKVLDTVHVDRVHRCAIYNLEVKDLK